MRISQTGLIPSSFQRVLLTALRDPGLIWIPGLGDTGIGLGTLFGDNVFVQFRGTGITYDFDTETPAGTITRIEISGGNDPEPESVATGLEMDFESLLALVTEREWTGFGGPDYNRFSDEVMEGHNRLTGSDGRDVLETGSGRDIVRAGPGWDVIILAGWEGTQPQPDRLFGGKGQRDLLVIEGASVGLRLDLLHGFVAERTDDLPILARLAGIENVRGSELDDFILGDDRDNRLWGQRGDDLIFAGGGNDRVFGGRGNDDLRGQDGNDIIRGYGGFDDIDGGTGHDILTGGNQGDRFIFDARDIAPFQGDDIITDFGNGSDSIVILGGPVTGMTVTAGNGLTLIDYGNGTITLQGVELTFDQIDFVYERFETDFDF